MLLTVHDELVFEVPTASPGVLALGQGQMETVFTLKVPLVVEVGAGADLGRRPLSRRDLTANRPVRARDVASGMMKPARCIGEFAA